MRTEQLSTSIAGDVTGGLAIAERFVDRRDEFPVYLDIPLSAAQLAAR